ncbi:sensor histidine kinase [Herbaspirillum sp. GCM10030257]|uniref:sensor histidine kinase n=1 Tax=Herbaspirillum sp. GCM10030257 TaxID=3273393 RepID=UPI00361C0D47
MMYEFLLNNRTALIERCRAKVAQRPKRAATQQQLQNGIPMFLNQLIKTLHIEQGKDPMESRKVSGPAGGSGGLPVSEIGLSAAQHGHQLLKLGFSVDQVVHDYGDLCQSITDLAFERDAPFSVDEFRTLNRCLDNAIADAVTEFNYQRDSILADRQANDLREQLGNFAHELRNLLGTASLAFTAAKAGNLTLTGATGAVLEKSLLGLGALIDRTLAEVRIAVGPPRIQTRFPLAAFIADTKNAATLEAQARGCRLLVSDVDPLLAVEADRDLLFAAVGNLLQNAFKFTRPHTDVSLNAHALGDRILIEVGDHCGGLPPRSSETLFSPFHQQSDDRSGLGLGLSIARQSVEASSGILSVRDVPGTGCVFTISLPRYSAQ